VNQLIRCICSAIGVAAQVGPALAQQPQQGFAISYEVSRDRFYYRFENPSSFDTPELVPHDFKQEYWGDNQWVAVQARYKVGERLLETEVAATPQRTTRGDDFDTFYQPSGDVIVSGTTGDVSLRSWRVRQTIALGEAAGLAWHVGYQYRRDRSIFHPGTKVVSHTRPATRVMSITYDRETTTSETHELRVGAGRTWGSSQGWRAALALDLAPTTNARLTTVLPDKYPGREILFNAVVFTLSPALTVSHGARWPLSLSVGYTRTFSYVRSRQFERNAVNVGVGIGYVL
jgi:hypothetical protein